MFRDLKTGGYNLEKTKVNQRRLIALILLISIAYTLATFQGASLQPLPVTDYICRPTLSGTFNRALWHFLDGIARSRLGSIFPKLFGFSLDSDESQASQTPLFSTRASRSIPYPEYLVALLSPLELFILHFILGRAIETQATSSAIDIFSKP